ncbi:MAG TPA: MMPL family transporter [Rhodopila sp.]|uniref:MMPL family transporter n=1 Tax=Rhodopila sp. TaxID=2480087 RepID=UPI002D0D7F42|nr:MMPL family transporter [Rhodopila sp.]HVY16323.1 MMPL family transporter [Rhodopila sp.]
MTARSTALLAWAIVLAGCIVVIARLRVDTDMAAFLPRSASPAQRVLVDEVRDGVLSRLVLLGIEGVSPDQAVTISKRMAATLREEPRFSAVENGEEAGFARDRDFLWSHRYVLSDAITADRFTEAGLHMALEHDLAELGSAAGFLVKDMLPGDPTGEMPHLLFQQRQGNGGGPDRSRGVWFSPHDGRALMLIRLRAAGSDIDGAQRALTAIHAAFHQASGETAARLQVTGPPVFAVEARDRIKSDAARLSMLAAVLVATALLLVYRSPRVLALSFVPVVTGALAGVAAVGLAFRQVHGITLGFGSTLIGEAVDYAVYLFTQTGPASPVEQTIRRIWPTLRLGVLTSVCGFAAMLLSSFEGFVQLGLFTIIGLLTAACVTRWVLPALLPAHFAGVRQPPAMTAIATIAARLRRYRIGVPVMVLAAIGTLAMDRGPFWAGDLTSLSPISPAAQRLDRSLRQDMKVPGDGVLIVVRRPDQEAALQAADRLSALLSPLIARKALSGFDTPTRYLPSLATQRARQAALPDPALLRTNLDQAMQGLPFQAGLFVPFVAAIAAARTAPPLTAADLDGTSLSLRLDSLLQHQRDGWVAVLSLRGVTDPSAIRQAIAAEPGAAYVDLKTESDRLLSTYLREGVTLACLGAGAIVLLLAASLRSATRLLLVMAPLVASVVMTLAILRLGGHALSIFNLFGLLLVVAIGSNYCLFFDRQRGDAEDLPRVLSSLLLANGCTVAGFGVLALSSTPVLHGLGMPVAIGTLFSLLFATILMTPAHAR